MSKQISPHSLVDIFHNASLSTRVPVAKVIQRFWDRVSVKGESECWEWTGRISMFGYAVFTIQGLPLRANRISYHIAHGPFDETQFVCHRCDNRKCVNPAHLFLGSAKDNVDDKVAKNRQFRPVGEKHPAHVLTEEIVLDARARFRGGERVADIARFHKVHYNTLYHAIHGRLWPHLPNAA